MLNSIGNQFLWYHMQGVMHRRAVKHNITEMQQHCHLISCSSSNDNNEKILHLAMLIFSACRADLTKFPMFYSAFWLQTCRLRIHKCKKQLSVAQGTDEVYFSLFRTSARTHKMWRKKTKNQGRIFPHKWYVSGSKRTHLHASGENELVPTQRSHGQGSVPNNATVSLQQTMHTLLYCEHYGQKMLVSLG